MNSLTSNARMLWLAVLGVVYGDIGTSPLYALKGCPQHDILGLISLFVWTILLIVSLKYVGFVLKLDNKGEGGVLALVTLTRHLTWGVVGLALFLGDSVLTPAISVLGALEGLSIALPSLPLSDGIPALAALFLLGLFALQRLGTHNIGQIFGPVMMVWFATLALLGLPPIIANPFILKALNPLYAVEFLLSGSTSVWIVLGHALLAVTGAEALYADLGHFGRSAIQRVWLWLVWPALMLNYLGQGAFLLQTPVANPFYALAPAWALVPLIGLATIASLIASQAVISGVFSLAWQGMMLGFFPRMRVVHTSTHQAGQIYVPAMNTLMCWGTLLAVGLFRNSESLAMAYGLSVASLMWMTTYLAIMTRPKGLWLYVLCVVGVFETGLVLSSLTKFWHGAWYTFVIASLASYAIGVWRLGHRLLYKGIDRCTVLSIAEKLNNQPRLPGIGVFVQKLNEPTQDAPLALLLHERYHTWLHEVVVCVNILVSNDAPKIKSDNRYQAVTVAPNVHVIQATYGFKEAPDLSRVMAWAREHHLLPNADDTALFYWGRIMPVASDRAKALNGFGEKIFVMLARLQTSQHELIRTPYPRTLELITHVRI